MTTNVLICAAVGVIASLGGLFFVLYTGLAALIEELSRTRYALEDLLAFQTTHATPPEAGGRPSLCPRCGVAREEVVRS